MTGRDTECCSDEEAGDPAYSQSEIDEMNDEMNDGLNEYESKEEPEEPCEDCGVVYTDEKGCPCCVGWVAA